MKSNYEPDWKPAKRVKNPKAMKQVHEQGCFCVLNCGDKGQTHHLLSKGQRGDDVAANLICLCLHHHNLVHAEDTPTLVLLGEHLLLERPDVVMYVKQKLGDAEGAAWLARRLFVTP
jgi:hypothetical protein